MKKLAIVFAVALAVLLSVAVYADDPVIAIDFEDGGEGLEFVNTEIVDDVTRGKVLKVNGQGNGTCRTSYALYTTDLFENTNWENGLTVSMWIQTDVGSQTLSGTAPIYSIDMGNQGYISAVCSLETTMNTDGNQPETGIAPRCWNDPANVSGGVNKTDEGIWQLLTVVYSPEGIKTYVDGEYYADSPLGGGDMDSFLFELEFATALRLGAWTCVWWNYGDYQGLIDDVKIWNEALSEDDVFDLYADTKKVQTVVQKAPTVEELYTAEDHTPVYVLDFEDASVIELNNAELVPGRNGNALKVKGEGRETNGTSYGLVNTDLFKNTDWTGGMTISMWVNADASDTLTGIAPIYSLDIGNIGYIALVNSLQSGINTDGNEDIGIVPRFWNDPGNFEGSKNETTAGQWDLVTVVYNNDGANNMAIYKNGESVLRPGMNLGTQFGEGTPEQFFTEQLNQVYSLRLGSWLCAWWNWGDYEGLIDDFEIYNVALNPLEVKYLFTGGPAEAEAPAEEPVVEEPAPAEEPAAEEPAPAEEPASKGFADVNAAANGKNVITAYTFVEGSNGFGGEGAENLWDGDTATKFCTNEFPVVSVAELDGVYTVNGFTMATANDNADYNGRSPSDWTISVSADGENWTTLASGDDTFFEETNFTYYAGDASAEGVSYVKLEAAASAANLFQVSELTLFGDKTADKAAETVDQAMDDKAEAPQTFDFGVIALIASAVTAGAALSLKKRK